MLATILATVASSTVLSSCVFTAFPPLRQESHEGVTALWAGNSPTVVQKHYRALVTQKAAKEFWSIVPDKKNVIQFPKANAEREVAA